MESSRVIASKTARILDIFLVFIVFICCALLGCGGNMQANPSTTNTPNTSPTTTNAAAHSVHLSWAQSTSGGVLGYNVYRATRSGGPYARLNPALLANPDYLDGTVAGGQTYYYAVTAATAVAESARSKEVVAVIPIP